MTNKLKEKLDTHVAQFGDTLALVLPPPSSENLRIPQSDNRNPAPARIDRELDYFYHTKFYDKIPR